MDEIIGMIRESLLAITNPHFYGTELGFQGELLSEIRARLPRLELDGAVVQQEYQKRLKVHGFRIRPEIIIHIPFEQSEFRQRAEGNFVVIELKLESTGPDALVDYEKLSSMCKLLDYPLAIFININSTETFYDDLDIEKDRIHAFAVKIESGQVLLIEEPEI